MEAASGTDEDVIAEPHFGTVEDSGVVVGEKIVARLYVVSVVAPQRRHDTAPLTDMAEQTSQYRLSAGAVGRRKGVVLPTQLFGTQQLGLELGVGSGVVQLTTLLFFLFSHDGGRLISTSGHP